jgi:hypothetical protein
MARILTGADGCEEQKHCACIQSAAIICLTEDGPPLRVVDGLWRSRGGRLQAGI